jgi:hypothetical protein
MACQLRVTSFARKSRLADWHPLYVSAHAAPHVRASRFGLELPHLAKSTALTDNVHYPGRGLNAGDWVQVIDRKHHDNGMVGVIDEIGDKDDDYAVYVWSESDLDTHVFRREQLRVVPAAVQTPAAAPAPRHSKDRSRSTSLHAGSATRRVPPQKGSDHNVGKSEGCNHHRGAGGPRPHRFHILGVWYNSSDQKLQRCITAEGRQWETKVQTDAQAQMIHTAGGDPPMTLAILDCEDKLGIKH